MKRLSSLLKIAIGAVIGVFLGDSLFTWWNYTAHPQRYAMQSAPWYLSIQINTIFTLLIVLLLLAILYFVRKRMK